MARARGAALFRVETKFQANSLRAAGEAFAKKIEAQILRPGAYAAANLLYEGMRAKVPVAQGTLRDSIYHYHDDKRSRPDKVIYLIGPNKTKAPHWYNVEFGHWLYNRSAGEGQWLKSKSKSESRGPGAHDLPGARKQRQWVMPRAYIRPTWDTYGQAALSAAVVRMSVLFREMR